MSSARCRHVAQPLPGGGAVVAGGTDGRVAVRAAEVFRP